MIRRVVLAVVLWAASFTVANALPTFYGIVNGPNVTILIITPCNGTGDDTSAIAAALASAAPGARLQLPVGTCRVSSMLTIPNYITFGGTTSAFDVLSHAPPTTIQWIGASGGTVMRVGQDIANGIGRGVTLHDFAINGGTTTSFGPPIAGIDLRFDCFGCRAENLEMQHAQLYAYDFGGVMTPSGPSIGGYNFYQHLECFEPYQGVCYMLGPAANTDSTTEDSFDDIEAYNGGTSVGVYLNNVDFSHFTSVIGNQFGASTQSTLTSSWTSSLTSSPISLATTAYLAANQIAQISSSSGTICYIYVVSIDSSTQIHGYYLQSIVSGGGASNLVGYVVPSGSTINSFPYTVQISSTANSNKLDVVAGQVYSALTGNDPHSGIAATNEVLHIGFTDGYEIPPIIGPGGNPAALIYSYEAGSGPITLTPASVANATNTQTTSAALTLQGSNYQTSGAATWAGGSTLSGDYTASSNMANVYVKPIGAATHEQIKLGPYTNISDTSAVVATALNVGSPGNSGLLSVNDGASTYRLNEGPTSLQFTQNGTVQSAYGYSSANIAGQLTASIAANGVQTAVAPVYTQSSAAVAGSMRGVQFSCTFAASTSCNVTTSGFYATFSSATSYTCTANAPTGTTPPQFTVSNQTTSSFTVYASASNSLAVNGICWGT